MIPVSSPGLIPNSANRSSETYTDSSLPAPLNQLRKGKNEDFYWNDLSLLRASLLKSAPTQGRQFCHGCGQLYGTTECLPRNSGGVRDSEFAHGVRTTLSSCQQNTNLFGWAWLITPTRLGFLFRRTFYITFWCNGIHD